MPDLNTTQEPETPEAGVSVEFCGEWYHLEPGQDFTIGRDADLVLDDNPYLHRRALAITNAMGFWWLCNVGDRLAATISDGEGRLQSWLAPGARLPLVLERAVVVLSAGSTTYELAIYNRLPAFDQLRVSRDLGEATIGSVMMTESQRLVVLALAEPMLLREGSGLGEIPTSAKAAARLGWNITRFNRKLDNVCDKLDRIGVRGLRGGVRSYATNRRARLVEYAISARLVTREDLPLLDGSARA